MQRKTRQREAIVQTVQEAEGPLTPGALLTRATHYDYAGLKHHHHFVCRVCGSVYDLAECFPQVEKLAPPSFVVESHEVTLHGLCGACAGAARH